jgi:ATP-dependent Lhr-like helicase
MATDATCTMAFLGPPPSSATALAALAEPLRCWFSRRFGEPTPIQRLAWSALAGGNHLLVGAPTGSGKTLAALLPILNQLLMTSGPTRLAAAVRCLYVTPLKSLGNDVRNNLQDHLQTLEPFLGEAPPVRVGLRTGDSSPASRARLRNDPPEVLVTTPESLAVLLSQPFGPDLFRSLRWVVVDEVHAFAETKRGADLSLSLERLNALAGDNLRRVGLSATCAPLGTAARFLVGLGRPCAVALVAEDSPLQLSIEPLFPGSADFSRRGFLERLLDRLEPELGLNRTTLIFTTVRSLAERLVWGLRRRYPAWGEQVGVHHSALAKSRRREVEHRLKAGTLRAVVSSTSLELGIDIGTVDGVVLVHPPGGVVRLLQRVGRAGHGPGRCRRGLVLTSTLAELLEAVVTTSCGQVAQVEPLRIPAHPLDVLCQQLLGMAAGQRWTAEAAFALVRQAYPYHNLSRADFDACLDYLSGRPRGDGSWLPARLRWEGAAFTIADERTARILRRNLGTIITEETRAVRNWERTEPAAPARAPAGPSEVGQIDTSFAERLQVGDRFLLDGRCLEFRARDGSDLLVEEVVGRPLVPRWGGEGWPLSPELARRLYTLRIRAGEALRDGPTALGRLLGREYGLPARLIPPLMAYFQRQEGVSEIPDETTCLVETVADEGGVAAYVHTPLNRAGNDALARVAVLRLARCRGWAVTSTVADLGLVLFRSVPSELTPPDWRTLLAADCFETDLEQALGNSETLRERFRRVALTGLMLLRNPLGRQRKVGGADWAERRLFEKVRREDPDFVLLRQAMGEVRAESCDAEAAGSFLRAMPRRNIRCRRLSQVSPFAESWTQATPGPVEIPETQDEALLRLHAELVRGER